MKDEFLLWFMRQILNVFDLDFWLQGPIDDL